MSAHHDLSMRTVVGSGPNAIVLEPRGGSVRVKMRGAPELFLPLDSVPALTEALRLYVRSAWLARA